MTNTSTANFNESKIDNDDEKKEEELNNIGNNSNTNKTSSCYLKSGKRYNVTDEIELDLHTVLPCGTYTVKQLQPSGEYVLVKIDNFVIEHKIYGKTSKHCNRIVRTYQERRKKKTNKSTGVLLAGEKGSGKTLLAKLISIEAAKTYNIPTIVINEPLCGDGFNEFIQMIHQPAVIIFDEFEKVYKNQGMMTYDGSGNGGTTQDKILTLLDGVYPSSKLFIITCNEMNMLNDNLLNRPGRIYYSLEFHGVDDEFIAEYCEDNLNDTTHIPTIITISKFFSSFNFDILQSLVEEMNRYDESPAEALEYINANPKHSGQKEYNVQLYVKENVDGTGKEVKVDMAMTGMSTWRGNPYLETIPIYNENRIEEFKSNDITSFLNGNFTFVNENKSKLVMKAVVDKPFDFQKAIDAATPDTATDADKKNKKGDSNKKNIAKKVLGKIFRPKENNNNNANND